MKKQLLILGILGLLIVSTDAIAKQSKILIVASYHPSLGWTDQCEKGIRSVIGDKYQIHTFYMDTKRLPQSEFQTRTDAAWNIFKDVKPDLVMIGDDNGLKFLGPKYAKTKTPVVYFGINNNPRNYFDKLPDNITGVLERLPIIPLIRHLKKIMPDSKKALLLVDKSPTANAIINMTFQKNQSIRAAGINTEYKIASNWNDWNNIVKNSKKYDMIILTSFHTLKDESGTHISIEDAVEWTSSNSPVPVFSNHEYAVGPKGAVGSFSIYGEAHGKLAGEIALEILKGKVIPKNIKPKTDREGKFYFSKNQLQRFNLKLPEEIKKQTIFK